MNPRDTVFDCTRPAVDTERPGTVLKNSAMVVVGFALICSALTTEIDAGASSIFSAEAPRVAVVTIGFNCVANSVSAKLAVTVAPETVTPSARFAV